MYIVLRACRPVVRDVAVGSGGAATPSPAGIPGRATNGGDRVSPALSSHSTAVSRSSTRVVRPPSTAPFKQVKLYVGA